jgi:hypothetical protein
VVVCPRNPGLLQLKKTADTLCTHFATREVRLRSPINANGKSYAATVATDSRRLGQDTKTPHKKQSEVGTRTGGRCRPGGRLRFLCGRRHNPISCSTYRHKRLPCRSRQGEESAAVSDGTTYSTHEINPGRNFPALQDYPCRIFAELRNTG